MAIYKMARGFGRHIRKKLKLKNTLLGLGFGVSGDELYRMVDGGCGSIGYERLKTRLSMVVERKRDVGVRVLVLCSPCLWSAAAPLLHPTRGPKLASAFGG